MRSNVVIMYLCGKVIAELELLEEGGHEDGGKEENDTPEEDIRNVGSIRATGAAHKLPSVFNTVLQQQVEGSYSNLSLISNAPASAEYRFPQIGFMSIRVHKKTSTEYKKCAFIVICDE